MSRIPLTKDGEILIKEKLYNLKFIERPKISEAIAKQITIPTIKKTTDLIKRVLSSAKCSTSGAALLFSLLSSFGSVVIIYSYVVEL